MKKMVVLLLLLLWPGCVARGETWTVDTAINPIYYVETFGESLPEAASDALDGTPFEHAKVRQGVVIRMDYKNPAKLKGHSLLLAAEHEGRTLLIGGTKLPGEQWKVWPASESFLRDQEPFEISARQRYDKEGNIGAVFPAVVYGEGYYMIGHGEGYSDIAAYVSVDANGNGLWIVPSYPEFSYELYIYRDGERTEHLNYEICLPARLEMMDADTFPRTPDDLDCLAQQYPLSDQGTYVFAANLREKPTGRSRSQGVYRWAPAQVLESKPGVQSPWYKVRIGDTEGWMSGPYVESKPYTVNHGLGQVTPPAIAQCKSETNLYLSPEGKIKQTLPAGTAMHIIADCGGWYHVVLPRENITWKLDAEGTYGYVRMTEVTEYTTLLNMKYGITQ